MTDDELRAFVEIATPEQITLWFALVQLAEAMQNVGQAEREITLEAVYRCVEGDDLSPWERAIERLGWE